MGVHLPWHDLLHRRARTLAALAGVVVAMVLLYMQIGFYIACRASSTRVLDLLEFDLVLTSDRYSYTVESDDFPRHVLQRAAALTGVRAVAPVRIAPSQWRDPQTRRSYDALALGIDPEKTLSTSAQLNGLRGLVHPLDSVLFDRASHPILGRNPVGTWSEMEGHRLRVVGELDWGAGFIAQGLVLMGTETFSRVFSGRRSDRVELGLIRLEPGIDLGSMVPNLKRGLPADVRLWSRAQILDQDRTFFMSERPIGLMFTSGVALAFLVGGIILFQILASEVTARRSELATLQALGYTRCRVWGMLVQQGLLYGLFAFGPATLISYVMFYGIRDMTRLPIELTAGLAAWVIGLSLIMCLAGATVAGRRLRQTDPADLF